MLAGVAAALTAVAAPAAADTGGLAAYLRARVAAGRGDVDRAAADYSRALGGSSDPVVAVRAYREALTAGEMALAARAAAVLDRAGVPVDDQPLLALARAAAAGDLPRYDAAVAKVAATKLAMLTPSLRAWSALAKGGDWERALADPNAAVTQRRLGAESRALLLIASGRRAEGAAALDVLAGWSEATLTRTAGAELLFAAGERGAALRSLPASLRPGYTGAAAVASRSPSLGFGASRTLTRLGGEFTTGDAAPLGVSLLRAALLADPGNDMARLLLAAALKDMGATGPALAALADVRADSPLRPEADVARVGLLVAAQRRPEALAEARRLAARPEASRDDGQVYADLLTDSGRPAEAVSLYRRIAEGEGRAEWAVWMQLGEALERAGDWPAARAALAQAVKLAPDEPLALNFLGYARVTRGEAKRDSTALLERARRLAPDNASIADSLGWAYHLTGDTPRALPLLEVAAAGEPANAEIAEHLGDAYWTLGRRFEARYAWTAAQVAGGEKERPRLERKMLSGL